MLEEHILVEQSLRLTGEVNLSGAKNAVLVIMTSTLLAHGKSILKNVPASEDVFCMIQLLEKLGVQINFDELNKILEIDTTNIKNFIIDAQIMKKMRASVLALGPLLARFGKAYVALPGGCKIGARPINYHLDNFKKMGALYVQEGDYLLATVHKLNAKKLVLEYPSVGATENIIMVAALTQGKTTLINAALEPEVLDLIDILKKMGAKISILAPASIEVEGVATLAPVEHTVMCDRLEAGSLLLAAAITGGDIYIPNARPDLLDVFLLKLEEMGHVIITGQNSFSPASAVAEAMADRRPDASSSFVSLTAFSTNGLIFPVRPERSISEVEGYGVNTGIRLIATPAPKAVSFKTMPYPGFPTDLQAPIMAALALADGVSEIEETVYENRLLHAAELNKMGANIQVNGTKALITGVKELKGADVSATDIRASCALVLAGLVASGKTTIKNIHHFKRGYDELDKKLNSLGAKVTVNDFSAISQRSQILNQKELI